MRAQVMGAALLLFAACPQPSPQPDAGEVRDAGPLEAELLPPGEGLPAELLPPESALEAALLPPQ